MKQIRVLQAVAWIHFSAQQQLGSGVLGETRGGELQERNWMEWEKIKKLLKSSETLNITSVLDIYILFMIYPK